MDTYSTVLFLHLLALFVGISGGAVIHACLFGLKAADTAQAATPWGMLAGKTEKVFPVAILGLFATGAYLTSDVWTWSTGWIDVSIVVIVILGVQGGGIATRRAAALKAALMANGPGPLGAEARALTLDKPLWIASFTNPAIVIGTIWNMTQKPGWGEAIAAIGVTYAIGLALALAFSRTPAVEASSAPEPAA
jgi:hypothetical protein